MASLIKAKLTDRRSSSISDSEADNYKLLVTAGPSYDQAEHKIVHVNTDTPTLIENEFLRAKISVKIRAYRGLPSNSPSHSAYFDSPIHDKDQYSIGFSFVPKQDLRSSQTVWGNTFAHSVKDRLPPGFNTAFKIVKNFIDPGLECDAYADQPWLLGPSLSCWFAFRVGEQVDAGDFPAPSDGLVMEEGADGFGQSVREKHSLPDANEKRRKHFLSASNRESFTFEKGRTYQGDFYNQYIDFGNFALKLPGYSLKVLKYVDNKSHCLRYVFMDRGTGNVYFAVHFHLLWGSLLERAVQDDKDGVLRPDVVMDDRSARPSEDSQATPEAEEPHVHEDGVALAVPSKSQQQSAQVSPERLVQERALPSLEPAQLHPGDHNATATYSAQAPASLTVPGQNQSGVISDVDEITKLLEATASRDLRETKTDAILPQLS